MKKIIKAKYNKMAQIRGIDPKNKPTAEKNAVFFVMGDIKCYYLIKKREAAVDPEGCVFLVTKRSGVCLVCHWRVWVLTSAGAKE